MFEMRDAYTRICERLGEGKEDDADVEMVIYYLSQMSEELGCWMYHYGHKFSGRQILNSSRQRYLHVPKAHIMLRSSIS